MVCVVIEKWDSARVPVMCQCCCRVLLYVLSQLNSCYKSCYVILAPEILDNFLICNSTVREGG